MASVWIVARDGARGRKYHLYFTDPVTGKNKHHKGFARKKDAQEEGHRLRAVIDTGSYVGIGRKQERKRPLTFREVGEALVEEWEMRAAKGRIKETTLTGYKEFLGVVLKDFGDRLVQEVSRDEVERYHVLKVRGISPASGNRRLFILKQVSKKAVLLQVLSEDPFKGIGYASEAVHQRDRRLSPEEADRLIVATRASGIRKYMSAITLLTLDFGASRQELLDLQWSQVDLAQGVVTFHRTKNGVRRTRNLTERCWQALLDWREHQNLNRKRSGVTTPESDRVFCHTDGRRFRDFKSSWQRVTKIAGLRDYHFHDNRHTFCSSIVNVGGSLKDVMEMIGHKDMRSANRYSHLEMDRVADIQRRVTKFYGRASGDVG